jgi:hypothetical protein
MIKLTLFLMAASAATKPPIQSLRSHTHIPSRTSVSTKRIVLIRLIPTPFSAPKIGTGMVNSRLMGFAPSRDETRSILLTWQTSPRPTKLRSLQLAMFAHRQWASRRLDDNALDLCALNHQTLIVIN